MTEEAKKEAPPKVERPRIELVFVGKGLLAETKKEGWKFREHLGHGQMGEAEYFLPAKGLHGSVGLIYSFEYEVPADPAALQPGKKFNSYWPSSQRYVGSWPDEAERAVWQAQARAQDIEQAAIRESKKAEGVVPMLDVLEPLRRKYSKTNATGKLAIEVLVLAYLRRQLKEIGEE